MHFLDQLRIGFFLQVQPDLQKSVLVQEGYELVTLSEMFYYKGVTPEFGAVYQDGNGKISKKK